MFFDGDADAGVGHREVEHSPGAVAAVEVDPQYHFADVGELDCVAQQVDEDLPQPRRIASERSRHIRRHLIRQLEALLMRPQRQRSHDVLDDLAEVEIHRVERQLARFDLREVEDVVEQAHQRVGRDLHHLEILALLRRQLGGERELGHADDAVHRRADLVAHVRQELALGAARLFGRLARVPQRLFGLLPLGDVDDRSLDHAGSVVPLIDDDRVQQRPDDAAVFLPQLPLEAAQRACRHELRDERVAIGLARVVVGQHGLGETLFAGGIPENPREGVIAVQQPSIGRRLVDAGEAAVEERAVARFGALQLARLRREPPIDNRRDAGGHEHHEGDHREPHDSH